MEANKMIVVSIVPNSINVDQLFDECSFLVQVLRHLKAKWASQLIELTPKCIKNRRKYFMHFLEATYPF